MFRQASLSKSLNIDDKISNGLVEIGEPPRWTLFDSTSPYYIPEDTFLDLNKTQAMAKKIKSLHNCVCKTVLSCNDPGTDSFG